MGISKKDLLNEVMGVPRAISMWVNLLTDINIMNLEEAIKNGDWEQGEGSIGVSGEKIRLLRTQVVKPKTIKYIRDFFGASSNEELLNNEEYKKLPLWNPVIITQVTVVPNEHFDIILSSGQYEAAFGIDGEKTKLTKIGKYEVLSEIMFQLDIIIPASDVDNGNYKNVIKLSKPAIAHELTHAFQKFKMYEKGVDGDFGREGVLNTIVSHEKGGNVGHRSQEWSDLTYLIYTHLSFEINARVTQLYYELKEKGVKTKEDIIKNIKESNLWEIMVNLRDFDSNRFIEDHMEIDPMFGLMFRLDQMSVGEKAPHIKNKEELLKYFIEKWDSEIKDFSEWSKENDRPIPTMASVPKSALKDPMVFLKFWENRFHKKAEEYRRKLLRVGQYLFNEINNKEK